MKRISTTGIAASTLFAVLALPVETIAAIDNDESSDNVRYTIADLGPVGALGTPFMVANNGLTAGVAATSDGAYHGTLWFYTAKLDIGTPGLGGPNSLAYGTSEKASAVGAAQTSDPNNEDFCGFNASGYPKSNTTCQAFVWREGVMHALPTLGGPNGYAYMINNRDEAAGYAETTRQDAGCPVHRFQPVVWKDGKPHPLETPGDAFGVAAYINESGQMVGASGACGSSFNTNTGTWLVENHPLRWDSDGTPHELGTFGQPGGLSGNHACAINNRGEAVGHLMLTNNPAGPFHAVRWPEGADNPEDLGTLAGDYASLALSVNDRGKVVGASFDSSFNPRASVWQKGVMTDLNTLIHGSSSLYLLLAYSINDRGEIVGFAATQTGEIHGFLAVPYQGGCNPAADAGGSDGMPRPVLSDEARELLRQQLVQHHVGLPQ